MTAPTQDARKASYKRIPNPDEQTFIEDARRIREGRLSDVSQLTYTGKLRENAEELVLAFKEDGEESFWKLYDVFTVEHPRMGDWIGAIKTASAPDEKQAEEAEKDDRFIVKNGKRIIKLWGIEDIYALPEPDYLIEPIFPRVGVSIIYGKSGTGKTFTALNIGLSIAHGKAWMERDVKQGNVFYINSEGTSSLGKRIKAWYSENKPLAPSPCFRIIPWGLDLKEYLTTLLDTIEDMAEEQRPDIIIFDNFSMCADIDQSKQNEVAPILKILNELAQSLQCHIMILHHTNKEDDFNGSMAFRNHTDVMIALKKEDDADKHSPILFCSKKARDEDLFGDIRTELKQVTLYVKEDTLQPVTSCVVVPSEKPSKSNGLNDIAQNMLDLLGDTPLSYTDWLKEATEALHIAKTTFNRYRDELLAKGHAEKCKVDGVKFEQYRKAIGDIDDQTREGNVA